MDTRGPTGPVPAAHRTRHRARWQALLQQAQVLLDTAAAEMEEYLAQRSDPWRDGERGTRFQERLEALQEVQGALELAR